MIIIKLLMDPLSNLSKRIKQLTKYHKNPMNDTKYIIRKLKTEAPVLSTIVDYSGDKSMSDILHVQNSIKDQQYENRFSRLMQEDRHRSKQSSKKSLSFLQYKMSPKKKQNLILKKSCRKSHQPKSFVIMQMPEQLTKLKSDLFPLPKMHTNTQTKEYQNKLQTFQIESDNSLSQYQLQKNIYSKKNIHLNKEGSGRTSIQVTNSIISGYKGTINNIIDELRSQEVSNINRFCQIKSKECSKLIMKKQKIKKQYDLFENMGRPAAKIMQLSDSLNQFQYSVDNKLDQQLTKSILQMDNKRYDLVLRHQQQTRKHNITKFKQRNKRYKIDECRDALMLSKNQSIGSKQFIANKNGKIIQKNTK